MANLEIHDGRNQVRRVRITRENPVMFGTDPMCDVVLEGAGVHPFHGRIRWKNGRFKVDASPEVGSIEVNGIQVKSKSFRQGDEVRVGSCRIFLLSIDDGPDHGEKTVVREIPLDRGRAAPIDYHRMEMAPPSIEAPEPRAAVPGSPEAPLKRTKYKRSKALDSEESAEVIAGLMMKHGEVSAEHQAYREDFGPAPRRGRFRLGSLLNFDRAPGDDQVLSSPIVIGLAITFALLVVFSVVTWRVYAQNMASRQYTLAVEDFDANNYPNAIKGFDQFLASNPEDRRAAKSKVLRALARVRQHTGSVGASWGNALKEARAMVEEVGSLEEYRDSSLDLADETRKTAEALADRAAVQADPKELVEAQSAIDLLGRIAGPATRSIIEKSQIGPKMDRARLAIRKTQDRIEALASMDAALKANQPNDAYSARDFLVRRYADLAADKEVLARLTLANEQVQKSVRFDPSGRPGETLPRIEPLGPPTSLVLRDEPGKLPSNAKGPVAFALVDGFAFGVDAGTGAPRWQAPVGLASPFPPVAIAGEPPSALVVDARSNELTRLDGRTGTLIWRQELGGEVLDPPLVLGNQVFQPTVDGRLLQIDLASGAFRGSLHLGRNLARTPVADDSAQHLYLLADEDCLFVLTLDPLSCVAVEYLGHEVGTVACPPLRAGQFFVLPENHQIDQGRWRVYVINPEGTNVRQVQEIAIGGWTHATPATSGPVIWSCSDRGELMVFSIGLADAKSPFSLITRIAPGEAREGPAFPKAKTERDFWLASSRSGRFELDVERSRLASSWTLNQAGPALAAPQLLDRVIVLTQQHNEGPGTALWGLDPLSGQVRWRTVFGSPWLVRLTSSTSTDALATLSTDGRNVAIGLDALERGGFIEQPLPKPGAFRLPSTTVQRLEIDGTTVVVPEPGASRVLVRVGSGEFRPIELPAPLASSILAFGKNLLIPGTDGRIYLIDPRTGTSTADPYVPPFDRSKPIRWQAPVALEGEAVALADSEGTIRRLSVDRTTRPRLVVTEKQKLDKPLAADPASTGASILIATADGRVRSLASRDLGPQGSWALDAPRLFGPVMVSEHAFVADSAGNVVAFAPDGRRLWSAKLRDTIAAGPPALFDQSAWFLGRDGSVQRFSLKDGTSQSRLPLDLLPSGGLLTAGPELVVPAGLGTVRLLDRKSIESSGASKP